MFAAIMLAVLMSRGIPARHVEGLVIVEGRPGCTAQALYNDPSRPIVVCK